MRDSARYAKIVEWSEEDQCYVSRTPGLIYAGCHGEDERVVFDDLCQIVEEAIVLYRKDGEPLPQATLTIEALRQARATSGPLASLSNLPRPRSP